MSRARITQMLQMARQNEAEGCYDNGLAIAVIETCRVIVSDQEAERMADLAYGRGFRRCLELTLKNTPVCILIGSGAFRDEHLREELRGMLRKLLADQMPGAVEGFDSL